jgi:hypothetical protein
MSKNLLWLIGVALIAPACGGSTSTTGTTDGGSGTGGSSATGGSGNVGNTAGTGNVGNFGGGGTGNVGNFGGGGTSAGGVGAYGGGGTGNVGGCVDCAPNVDGLPCCSPGSGCATTDPGGGVTCNCGDDYVWHCGTGSGGTGGGPGCGPNGSCGPGFTCCGDTCVNPANDIHNCGACGVTCPGPHPFCNGAQCDMPPCGNQMAPPPGTFCCGNAFCDDTSLCCEVQQGPAIGPTCYAPVNGTCPMGCPTCVCASPDTPIATPSGPRPIASLRAGDRVYSVNAGRIVDVPIQRTRRITAHAHVVMHVELASGATLEISAPHPTADGRTFGDLSRGDELDGVRIVRVERVPYTHDATYDILPDSDSGTYFAGGVLIGSTLAEPLSVPMCRSAR